MLFKSILLFSGLLLPVLAQRQAGELRLHVVDAAGLPLEAAVEILSRATGVEWSTLTDGQGQCIFRNLPFGPYRILVTRSGFAGFNGIVQVRSESPIRQTIVLRVAPVETALTIRESETLLDPARTGSSQHIGSESLDNRRSAAPGRGVLDLVNRQPGWLLEANGVLHPRGSEYDTQYVIDGIPVLDNRSPAFAPAFEPEELSSMRILTGGYPAEYGRKLGGVIELVTARQNRPGFHGKAVLQGGSFNTRSSYLLGQYVAGRTTVGLGAQGAATSRFLDPPVELNLNNRATAGGATARLERDWSDHDHTRFYFHRKRTGFLVPNELVQHSAGQRQDRRGEETMGQVAWQRMLSPSWVFDARAMIRDVSASLWSNSLATPVMADQDRGFRETYATASASATLGRHAIKLGSEGAFTRIRERFRYRITDKAFFEDDGELGFPAELQFSARRNGREYSTYVQDVFRAGPVTLSAGLRWDRYRLLVSEHFLSPRLAAAWSLPRAGLVLRASYDRAITIPAIENLLLTAREPGMPVHPARGNYYEAGLSKALGPVRLDASWYRRNVRNFADDDVFLNTGVSFPIAFDRAVIRGFEAKVELPRWRTLSGFVSYSNLVGTGRLPITGGLFLDDDAAELLASNASFPISQDQRNTIQTRLRQEFHPRVWTAAGFSYNSGLPFEIEGDLSPDPNRYGAKVISQADFARGRVRPSHALDVSLGINLWRRESRTLTLQADALNLTNRFNLINFAGLFSGTAIGAPRTVHFRLQAAF